MSDPFFLPKAPIVEAILDFDCDMPVGQELPALEKATKDRYLDRYPRFQEAFEQLHEFMGAPDGTVDASVERTLDAYRSYQDDNKQLVQVRRRGFSFNRLDPYPGLDALLPEIERVWRLYVEIASPQLITRIQLRYINRILIPLPSDGRVDLDEYLARGPRVADEGRLTYAGFLSQYTARDSVSGHFVATVLTAQPAAGDKLPLIFDNAAIDAVPTDPADWPGILGRIQSLRELKNHVFRRTLTEKCLNLFR